MPGLTPEQIHTGVKRNVRAVPKPRPPAGRWRCLLCPWPRWETGTYTDWKDHYRTTHQGKG